MENYYITTTNQAVKITVGKNGRRDLLIYNPSNRNDFRHYIINESAADIIGYLGSKYRFKEIVEELTLKYNADRDEVKNYIESFLSDLQKYYHLNIQFSEEYIGSGLQVVQETKERLYPYGALIEVTERCNFKCIHCYAECDNSKNVQMSLEQFKTIVDQFVACSVESIEISGGELMMNPDIMEMIQYLLDSPVPRIGIITNGSLINDEIIELIRRNPERFLVQIDLHGIEDDYLKWFTGIDYKVEHNLQKIEGVSRVAHYFRVATIVTKRNLDQLETIADWLYNHSVPQYGVSLVVPDGRAGGNETDLFLNQDELIRFGEIVESINRKYPNFISMIDDNDGKHNCGCISNCVAVDARGYLKMCAMDRGNTITRGLGNILDEHICDIYNKNEPFILQVDQVESPKIDNGFCGDCIYFPYCSNCLLRGFTMAKRLGGNCKWFNSIPQIIQNYVTGKEQEKS